MNVGDAEMRVVEHWVYLGVLLQRYPGEPDRVSLLGEASFNRLKQDIRDGLSWENWTILFNRLRTRQECCNSDRSIGEQPVLSALWKMVDRRPALGIKPPRPSARQTYPLRTRKAG